MTLSSNYRFSHPANFADPFRICANVAHKVRHQSSSFDHPACCLCPRRPQVWRPKRRSLDANGVLWSIYGDLKMQSSLRAHPASGTGCRWLPNQFRPAIISADNLFRRHYYRRGPRSSRVILQVVNSATVLHDVEEASHIAVLQGLGEVGDIDSSHLPGLLRLAHLRWL